MMRRRLAALGTLAVVALFALGAAAQGYPQKNVQYIVPFVPGGESDDWPSL